MRNTRSNAMTKRNRAQKFAVGIAIVALLAIIFGTVFAGTLSGAFGIEKMQIEQGNFEANVADAAVYDGMANANNAITFKNNQTNVNNYIVQVTKNDKDVSSSWGYTGNISATTHEASTEGINENYTFKHDPTFGILQESDKGTIEYVGYVPIKVGGDYRKKYSVSASANISLWVESGGTAMVTAKAAVGLSTTTNAPSNFDYPADLSESDRRNTKNITAAQTGGIAIAAEGHTYFNWYTRYVEHYQAFGNKNNGNAQIKSNSSVEVPGGSVVYVFFKFYSTDNRNTADTWRALLLDSVSTSATDKGYLWGGTGTESDPFQLKTREDFDTLSAAVQRGGTMSGENFKVMNNVDFDSTKEFIPIGGVAPDGTASTSYKFAGNLNGNSKTISNIKVSRNERYSGLFGLTDGTTISNLTISNPAISGSGTSRGAFIGRSDGTTTLTNCTVSSGSVTATYQAGGLIGYSSGAITFTNCKNQGTAITTTSQTDSQTRAGGFLGSGAEQITISGTSSNSGAVSSSAGADKGGVGGLIGYSAKNVSIAGTVTNSGAIGTATNKSMCTGGIVGWIVGSLDCTATITNSGTIYGSSAVGGCFGLVASGNISKCKNTGDVYALGDAQTFQSLQGAHAGGIVGHFRGAAISNCYNSGTVSTMGKWPSSNDVGGIAGYSSGTIQYCYVTGTVGGSDNVGGIVGYRANTIENCYFDGTINSYYTSSTTGFLTGNDGNSNSSNIKNCFYFDKNDNFSNIPTTDDNGTVYTPTTTCKDKQDNKVSVGAGVTIYGATKNTSWGYISNWENITSYNVVGIRASAPIANTKYLQLYSPTEFIQGKDEIKNGGNASNANVPFTPWAYFTAERTTDIDVRIGEISLSNNTVTYNGASTTDPSATLSNVINGIYNFKWYFSGTALDGTVCNVAGDASALNAPNHAGTYTSRVDVLIGDIIVGRYNFTYTVNKKELTLTPLWSGTPSSYIYNSVHQGIKSLTVGGVVSPDNLTDIVDVQATNGITISGTYSFGNAINVGNYNVIVNLTGENIAKNYKLPNTSSWNWTINKYTITFTPTWTNYTDKSGGNTGNVYTYNGQHQGVSELQFSLAANDYSKIEQILSVSNGTMTVAGAMDANDANNYIYTIRNAVNYNSNAYSIQVSLQTTGLAKNYKFATKTTSLPRQETVTENTATYNWNIIQRELILNPTWYNNAENTTYTYNGNAQGIASLSIPNIVSGENFDDIVSVSATNMTVSGQYTFSQSINVGTYGIAITKVSSASNYSMPAKTSWNYTINKRHITLKPTYTNGTDLNGYIYIYDTHQGLSKIGLNDAVVGEKIADIIDVNVNLGMTVSNTDTIFEIGGAIDSYVDNVAQVYVVNVSIKNDNYTLDGVTDFSWTIAKRKITLTPTWTANAPYTYNMQAQGLTELEIDDVSNFLVGNVVEVINSVGPYTTAPELLSQGTFFVSASSKNAGTYSYALQIKENEKDGRDDNITYRYRDNYELNCATKDENGCKIAVSSIGGYSSAVATFEWTISPKTINIGSRQDNGYGFQYGGTVANNGNANSHGYPLSRYEHYFPTDANAYKTPAFVYQGEGYALGNFKVYDLEELTLVGSGTESGLANKLFKAQFRFLNADGGIIQDWTDVAEIGNISLKETSAPQIIALRFESLDGNYQFDTDNDDKNRTIYYTLMISDFGVLTVADKERDDAWGSRDNPYVISTVEHMVRLSHIVNGADSWDSIRKNGSTVGFATDNHYTDAYFVVTANIDLSKTQNMMPIGGHNMDGSVNIDHYFSGTFGGVHLVGGHVPYVADENDIDQIQYDVHKSATLETDEIFTISLHGNMATSSYVGLFGIIKGARIAGLHIQYAVKHDAVFVPQNYRGGVVGLAEGRSASGGEVSDGNTNIVYSVIENVSAQASYSDFVGKDYTGGLIGYAINTQILQYYIDGKGKEQPFTRFVNGTIKGENYVGGIVGFWIINDSEQIGGNDHPLAHSADNFYVEGKAFVGSHVGYADASAVKGKLVVTPWTTPQANGTGSVSYSTTVVGKEFFGGLYGAFIGNGYKKNSLQNDADETTLVLNPSYVNGFNIYAASGSTANVVGGLAGYISNVGVKIVKDGNIQMFHFTSKNNAQNMLAGANFLGYFFGIIGENATLENPTDFTSGNIHNIGVSEDHGISGGSFVGGIAGYMSAGAGVYYGSSGTLFGNKIAIVIAGMGSNSIEGTGDYVGGVFGAIGRPEDSVIGTYVNRLSLDRAKTILQNTMSYGSTTLTFGPQTYDFGDSTAQPIGRVANLGDVKGKNYVGGIVGAVFSKARLDFKNPVYTSKDGMGNLNTPYLHDTNSTGKIKYFNHTRIYNGHQADGTNNYIKITGTDYVGGIAGKLFGEYHELKYIMSRAYIIGSSYVGGIVGEMANGSIENSASVLPLNKPDGTITSSADCYQGTSYVGGIVGNLSNGTVKNSITTGMKFTGYAATKADVGGIAGAKGQNASVVASWAIYAAESATYSTVPANDIGKFVVLDKSTAGDFVIPKYVDIACMIGLYNFDIGIKHVAVHDTSQVQPGYLTFAAKVPTTGNKQIVFYDGSGTDTQTNNTFAYFVSQNDKVSLRFGALGAEEQDSMIITKTDVVFKNIAPWPSDDPSVTATANAAKGYRAPSAGDRYMADVDKAVYGNSQNNISELTASIKFNGTGSDANGEWQVVGHYSNTFTLGGDTPYIIASQKDWDEFAHSVYSGTNNYQGKTVRLMTDSVVINNSTHYNNLDFSRNGGYNFAGDISTGESSAEASKSFQGTFDGNGYKITVNYTGSSPRVSTFPNAMNATFKNLTIAGSINAGTSASNATYDVAAFVAKPFGKLTFENCTNAATVSGLRNVGGLVGYCAAGYTMSFIACVNTGSITSYEGSYTLDGAKSTKYSYDDGWGNTGYTYGTGGIIGTLTGTITIESCRNSGNITGGHNVGGIIGLHNGTSSTAAKITVNNCANTGNITADSGYKNADEGPNDGDDSRGIRQNIFGYAGGIIGKTGQYSYLNMFASYNAGRVMTLSNIAGGLVGSVGAMYQPKGEKNSVRSGGKSTIAYCYNIGTVYAGGTRPKHVKFYDGGRENYGGSIVGGIAGLVGNILITQCYNAGDIYAYGVIAYGGSWQNREGGIVGQSQPGSNEKVEFTNLYNVGNICLRSYNCWVVGGFNVAKNVRYGATISGYCDTEDASKRISSSDIYSIANAVSIHISDNYANDDNWAASEERGDWIYDGGVANIGAAIESLVVAGQTFATVEQLTAYMTADGDIAPAASESNKLNLVQSTESLTTDFSATNIKNGWIYVYGCLPQLAVFALDTRDGLSMRSIGYGKNMYGEYEQGRAGSQQHPYIIKDGVDLLGMMALSMNGYSFANQYIEVANKDNNLDKVESKQINMPTTTTTTSSLSDIYLAQNGSTYYTGKSYHLLRLGALCNTAYTSTGGRQSVADEYGAWVKNNNRFNTGSTATASTAIGTINMYPIGGTVGTGTNKHGAIFEGNISGEQADGTNTAISNLRIATNSKYASTALAGLFGEVKNATISHITVSGTISTINTGRAGGIVGQAGANTIIDHCINTATINGYSYAGGIVGYTDGNIRIINCETNDATIRGNNSDLAGIVGYADGSSANVYIDGCVVNGSSINATATTDSTIKTIYNIGGIIGRSADSVVLNISNCTVGNVKDVAIIGTYNVGGIIGQATQNTRIENCEVGSFARIVFNKGYASGNSIGGIAGKANKNVTFGGKLTFNGTIVINYSTDIDVSNIGGIVGYMSSGSTFEEGTVVNVGGYIDLANITNQNVSIENIGGVAGYTEGVTFSGNFTVAPRISLTSEKGTNVGGFIGLNIGATAILATDTEVKISGNISGATAVGGFIGKNDANADFNIAPDSFNGRPYITNTVTININGNITGTGDNVGGLVGLNASGEGKISVQKGTITIGGTVNGQNNVGGIVGNNSKTLELGGSSCTRKDERGTIKDALEITQQGKVTGKNNVGGLIGLLANGNIISGELSNSGAVEGCIAVGGIIGKFQDGTISGNFTNTGSVKGVANGSDVSASIGGSIGEMDEGAKIDGARKATKFVNGGTDTATTSADALAAADNTNATVEGANCVGGSIGAMLGTIVGSGELKVQFENHAQVTGANYVGGSIGLLVGTVDYAVFVNDGEMGLTGNAVCSLGGSIGFVGVPNDATLGVGHRVISISNSHFEFDGQIDTTGSSSTTDTGTSAGIGGVIGVIRDGASETVERFENNTFYVSGNVNAGNLNNVGGVIGLIAANNIKISNMLAYRTEVKGYANVGGIVGATIASGTVIDNAFNVEGNVVGTAKGEGVVLQVGGIIGLAHEDTNASTSYWVKGFNNADLEKADINDLGAFLGKYGNITVDEKLLRTSTSSPTLYIDEAILANPDLEQTTQEQEQIEKDDDGNEIIVGYITTRTATVSVVLARGTASTTVTLKRVITTTVSTFEGTTKTETQYTYSVGGGAEVELKDNEDGTSNDTWNAILDACGYGYKISNEMYVFENSAGDTYTTGKENTGWYFAYANDVKIKEGENEVDAINTVHNTDANLQYWKHIANAYSADELLGGIGKLEQSNIIKEGLTVEQGHVYATAKKGNNRYYLYVATSNKDVLPTITADNDDAPSLFYIDVFANSTDAQAGNIAIYYKLLEIATSIKYNGYDRHVPVKNNDLQYGERSGYYYTVENGGETQHFKNVGTYGGSVAVYYKTATATYEFGGVATTEWKIVAKEITVVNSSLNGTYGGANNVTTITADGIAQPDKDNFVFVVTIDGVKYKLKPVASGAFEVYDVEANEWKSSIEYNAGKNITFESFNIEESKAYSKNDKSYSVYGASGAKWQKAVLKIRFSKAKRYELGFGYDGQFGDETSTQKNYTLKSTVSSVNVKPKLLNISIDSNRASAVYDGKEHNTSWMITGWENNEKLSTSYEGKTYEQLFGITAYYAEANSTNYTATSKVAISYNSNANEVYMQNAKDAGSYTLHFGENVKKSTNTYTVGNYYFKIDTSTAADRKGLDNNKLAQPFIIGVTKIVVVTKSDSPSNHVYDGNPGKITFTFSVEDMSGKKLEIADYIDIINGYYNATVNNGSPAPKFEVERTNSTQASVTFDTGVNANTYTATLTLKNGIDATQKANCLPADDGKDIKQTHIISKRNISAVFDIASGTSYEYNTEHQGLSKVSVNSASGNVGLISGDTVTLNLSVTNGKGWNTSKNGYTPGGALGIITSDAGEYTATVTSLGSNAPSNKNRNYELSGTTSCTWTINKKDLTMSVASGSAVYDGTEHFPTVSLEGLSGNKYGEDTITFGYKIQDNPDQKIVNAGTYNLTCDSTDLVVKRGSSTTGANGVALVDNYNITGGGASTFMVSPAPLTVSWTNDPLIYNGKAQGQVLASASSNGRTFTVNNGNVVNAFEGDVITFTLSGQEINATNAGENYQMTASATSLTNAQRPTSMLGNYTITIPECVYNIQKAPIKVNVVRIDGISGTIVEKVYDATRDVKGTPSVDWSSTNGGVTPKENEYTITVIYDSADAGERTITYTVTELNNNYACDVLSGTIAGRITPLALTVELDRLRGDKATKTFDDSISYGGAGFEGNSAGRSRTYRIGEGFSVSGFPSGGSSVNIVANYAEVDSNRSQFNAYINNVVKNGENYEVDGTNKKYKKLVFTMSGSNNYTFVVKRGTTVLATSANGVATVFDKDDTANVGSGKATSNVSIEITVAQLKASYGYTAQSYANADNTYNTKWEPVTATSGVSGLDIAVVNGWMTDENGQPKVYEKYTVIRGRDGNTQLSASITKDANGKYINYRLSNQPILTIGYFVSGGEFEIGSLASLMIATYYQYAAQHGEDGNFNPVISSIATWMPVVSNTDYESGSFDKPIDAGECTSWDEYFAMKENNGINIFLNAYEGNVWGYYESKEQSAPTQYKSYKQVANVSGIMTDRDITILDNFFITAEGQKTWGVGGDYITNFVKVGVGNVIIAIGSLFGEDFGTEYSYDGNGYTINHVNIINYTDNANVGMFASVNGGEIKNVNLRNFSIVSNGSGNVGGIVATGSNATLVNSTFHGSITVNGNANVGGLIGGGNMGVDGAIVLGNIDAIGTANVGGVIGIADGNAINNVVSMIEVYADGNVGAIVGTGSVSASSNQVFYLAHSAWHRKVGENNPIIANSNYGTSKTYTELFNGSISGYGSTKYYTQNAVFGTYDVVKNIVDIDEAVHAPRESMNLRDIVDVYLLMYSLSEYTLNETSGQKAYAISASSWLVGNKHGTTNANDAIVIANQQGVALLRELRFATFTLANDVEMYSTHGHSVFDGVFYGTVIADGHKIYLQGANAMFEYTVNALPIEQKKV